MVKGVFLYGDWSYSQWGIEFFSMVSGVLLSG